MNSALSSPAATLMAECAAMQALLDLLTREQACLIAADAAGCAALLDDKAAQIAALSTLAARRHQQLAALGLPADEHGMRAWLRTDCRDANGHAAQAWQTLLDITRAARQRNRINGLLLGQLAARNRQALDALAIHSDGDALYGPHGQTGVRSRSSTRWFG